MAIQLDEDVLNLVFQKCRIEALGRISSVCNLWNNLVTNDTLWKDRFQSRWPAMAPPLTKQYRVAYKEMHEAIPFCASAGSELLFTDDGKAVHISSRAVKFYNKDGLEASNSSFSEGTSRLISVDGLVHPLEEYLQKVKLQALQGQQAKLVHYRDIGTAHITVRGVTQRRVFRCGMDRTGIMTNVFVCAVELRRNDGSEICTVPFEQHRGGFNKETWQETLRTTMEAWWHPETKRAFVCNAGWAVGRILENVDLDF